MLRNWYRKLLELAERKEAVYWLAAVSAAESSFFPIPPDVMLVPMVLANRAKAWFYAFVCSAASVVGGLFGYAIGFFLISTLGGWIIRMYGMEHGYDEFQAQFDKWGLWIILAKGLTPIPYKVVAIACGAAQFSLLVFFLASVVTRAARFYMVAALLRWYGNPIRNFIEKYLTLVTTGMVVLVVGGLVILRFV